MYNNIDKYKTLIIFVASKEEADLLLPKDIDNYPMVYTVITGYGMGGTIERMSEYDHGETILNVGFVGVPETMELHKLYSVSTSILGPNDNNFNKPSYLQTIEGLPQLPCITVTDFETNPSRFYPKTCYSKEYLIDMELYPLAKYFDNVYSIKVPSDSGDLKEYFNQVNKKKELQAVKSQIETIIKSLINYD